MGQSFRQESQTAHRPRSTQELLAAGVGRGALRGPRWRRVARGFYTPAIDPPLTPAQRILDAVPLIGAGALGGWAAGYVHGAQWLDGIDPFNFDTFLLDCLGLRRASLPTVRFHNSIVPAEDRIGLDGIVVTSALRTAFDGMRWAPSLEEGVVFADAMAHFAGVGGRELVQYADDHPAWPGVDQARCAARLMDGGVLSPWESRLRCCYLLEAGLPARILLNVPVFAGGREIGWPDIFDPEAALAVEFDGEHHRDLEQHHRDNIREEAFEDANVTVVRADSLDLRSGRQAFIQRVRNGYVRGLARDRSQDRWTLESPRGWRPHSPR
ncbi:PDDEXK family nuclease [Microlunatus soli]|uniref:DUF559 domain-containing protein n=1 Tax=Microlunatus soli TaxID=630515 RepID=A0A1H1S173_9ACTN|nr:hypothetical protein [Microlunatus soli]SDS41717.1 hypothetical protein SAMN04489812_1844 [Microlunatus soli]